MPSFMKDLSIRRRSKHSFKSAETRTSSGSTSGTEATSDDPPPSKSTSTLGSIFDPLFPEITIKQPPAGVKQQWQWKQDTSASPVGQPAEGTEHAGQPVQLDWDAVAEQRERS